MNRLYHAKVNIKRTSWLSWQRLAVGCCVLLGVLFVSACGSDEDAPPTEIVVITDTPMGVDDTLATTEARIAALESTLVALEGTLAVNDVTPGQVTTEAVSPEVTADLTASTSVSPTPMATETDLPSLFPTPQVEQTIVVEQIFEGGRMIWFRESRRIWVLVGETKDPLEGQWFCFEDTFLEGDVESLPTFAPPPDVTAVSTFSSEMPRQPIRGFGKIWRENEEIRQKLGWALTSEIEHSARREYIAGGILRSGTYVPGAGEWRVGSFFRGTLVFLEAELNMPCPSGTWRLRI